MLSSLSDTARKFNRAVQKEMVRLTPKRTGKTAREIEVLSIQKTGNAVRGMIRAPITLFWLEAGTKAHMVRPVRARALAWEVSGSTRTGIPLGRGLLQSGMVMAFSKGHVVGGVRPRFIFERALRSVLARFRA